MHRFTLVPELNLVISDYAEDLDDRSLMEHLLDVYDNPGFRPGMDELSIFLRTRHSRVTPQGLRQIASTFPRKVDVGARPNFLALVTTSKLGYGLSRLYGAHADRGGVTTDVFDSVAAAADWLDECRGREQGTTAAVAGRALDQTGAAGR